MGSHSRSLAETSLNAVDRLGSDGAGTCAAGSLFWARSRAAWTRLCRLWSLSPMQMAISLLCSPPAMRRG